MAPLFDKRVTGEEGGGVPVGAHAKQQCIQAWRRRLAAAAHAEQRCLVLPSGELERHLHATQ